MAISFGVVTGVTCSYGTVNSSDVKGTAEIADARSALGLITHQQAYSRTKKASLTAVLTGTAPEPGASATIAGITGLLEAVDTTEVNTAYAMVSATVTKGDAATQVALA